MRNKDARNIEVAVVAHIVIRSGTSSLPHFIGSGTGSIPDSVACRELIAWCRARSSPYLLIFELALQKEPCVVRGEGLSIPFMSGVRAHAALQPTPSKRSDSPSMASSPFSSAPGS